MAGTQFVTGFNVIRMQKERSETFVSEAMHTLAACRTVLDVGGGERFGKWMQSYKPLFDSCNYKTMDYDPSTGADVIGDIHAIPLPDASVDGIICSSVLEHVLDPLRAVAEMQRVVRLDGYIFVYVPSLYPYHARPGHYPDYWRFFEDTLREMFSESSELRLQKRGGYFLALSFFVPFQHKLRWILTPVAEALDAAFKTEGRSSTAGYYVFARV